MAILPLGSWLFSLKMWLRYRQAPFSWVLLYLEWNNLRKSRIKNCNNKRKYKVKKKEKKKHNLNNNTVNKNVHSFSNKQL